MAISYVDSTTLANALLQKQTALATPLTTKRTDLTTKSTDLSKFRQAALDINTAVTNLGLASLFNQQQATSTTAAFSATADGTATSGSYAITVSQFATANKKVSATGMVATASVTASDSEQTLTIGSGSNSFTIKLSNQTDTLNNLVSLINNNSSNNFVTASLITDSTGSRLIMAAKNTGTSNALTVSGTIATALNLSDTVVAQNAKLKVDGVELTSASNTLSGVVSGVNLTLNPNADLTTTSVASGTLRLSSDTSGILSAMNTFVDKYNVLVTLSAQARMKNETTGVPISPLYYESSMLNQITRTIRGVVNGASGISNNANGVSFQYLSQLGFSHDKDGKLSLKSTTFNTAMADTANYDVFKSFFTDSTKGFSNRMYNAINSLTATDTGLISNRVKTVNKQIDDIDNKLTALTASTKSKEAVLKSQLATLNAVIANANGSLNSLGSSLSMTLPAPVVN